MGINFGVMIPHASFSVGKGVLSLTVAPGLGARSLLPRLLGLVPVQCKHAGCKSTLPHLSSVGRAGRAEEPKDYSKLAAKTATEIYVYFRDRFT